MRVRVCVWEREREKECILFLKEYYKPLTFPPETRKDEREELISPWMHCSIAPVSTFSNYTRHFRHLSSSHPPPHCKDHILWVIPSRLSQCVYYSELFRICVTPQIVIQRPWKHVFPMLNTLRGIMHRHNGCLGRRLITLITFSHAEPGLQEPSLAVLLWGSALVHLVHQRLGMWESVLVAREGGFGGGEIHGGA